MAASPPPPRQGVLDYLFREATVESIFGSRQHHQHGDFRVDPRTLDDTNLLYIARGRARWFIGDQTVDVAKGDLLVVHPHEPHHALPRTKRTTVGSIHVRLHLPGGRDAFRLARLPRVLRVVPGSRLDRYFQGHLADHAQDPDWAQQVEPGWAQLVTFALLEEAHQRGVLRIAELDPTVDAMMAVLRDRLAKPTTLDDLAAVSGYSAQHLNRLFNRTLGTTPIKLLTGMRLDHAAKLLTQTALTVAAVGERVGYDDPYHFSRAFSSKFGRSPSSHRAAAGSEYPS